MQLGELTPTAWYYPSACLGRQPCRWEGWVQYSATSGRVWLVVSLFAV